MKTIKQVEFEPVYCDPYLPGRANMEPNKLYICLKHNGTSHLCFCGCGVECYLNINEEIRDKEGVLIDKGWDFKDENGKVTLSPSILQRFECKSHYIITKNKANFV